MTDWHEHLNEAERQRVAAIKDERLALGREMRRIYDRARKRADRA